MLSVFLTFTVFLTIKVLFFCCLLELLDLYYIYLLSSYLFLRYLRCGSSEIQVSPTPVCPINIGWIFYLISIQRVWTATRLPFPVLVRICYRILPLYWILPTEIDSKIYFSFNIGGNNCKGKKKKDYHWAYSKIQPDSMVCLCYCLVNGYDFLLGSCQWSPCLDSNLSYVELYVFKLQYLWKASL